MQGVSAHDFRSPRRSESVFSKVTCYLQVLYILTCQLSNNVLSMMLALTSRQYFFFRFSYLRFLTLLFFISFIIIYLQCAFLCLIKKCLFLSLTKIRENKLTNIYVKIKAEKLNGIAALLLKEQSVNRPD